jgi:hypothetical protein
MKLMRPGCSWIMPCPATIMSCPGTINEKPMQVSPDGIGSSFNIWYRMLVTRG